MCDTTKYFIDFKRLPYIIHKCLIERAYIAAADSKVKSSKHQASRALFILLFIIIQWWNREVSKFSFCFYWITLSHSEKVSVYDSGVLVCFFPILLFDCNRTLYSLTLNQPYIQLSTNLSHWKSRKVSTFNAQRLNREVQIFCLKKY